MTPAAIPTSQTNQTPSDIYHMMYSNERMNNVVVTVMQTGCANVVTGKEEKGLFYESLWGKFNFSLCCYYTTKHDLYTCINVWRDQDTTLTVA